MTVIQPNSVAGINSITVQSGNSLAVHKANGELIRTITSNSGVSTFSSISVGTAATTNSAGKSINIGLGASISQHVDNSLSFGTGGDERARIDSSGRLLIGHTATTSKDRQVQLVGTTADGSSYMALRHSADANGSRLDLCKSRNATPGSNTIVVDDDVLGSIDFLGDDGTDIQSVGASIVAQVDGTPGSNDMPGRLIFRTTADGAAASTERLRIDSSGRLLIGTATASSAGNSQYSKLEVSGNTSGATGAGHLSIKRGTAVGSLSSGDTLGRLVFSGLDGGDFAYIQVSADAAPGSSDYPGRMMFFTTADGASSSTERLRIKNDGIIEMGTSVGQSADNNIRLKVGRAGDCFIGIRDTNAQSQTGLKFGDAADEDAGQLYYDNGDNTMRFHTNGDSVPRFRINSWGGLSAVNSQYSGNDKSYAYYFSFHKSGAYNTFTVDIGFNNPGGYNLEMMMGGYSDRQMHTTFQGYVYHGNHYGSVGAIDSGSGPQRSFSTVSSYGSYGTKMRFQFTSMSSTHTVVEMRLTYGPAGGTAEADITAVSWS